MEMSLREPVVTCCPLLVVVLVVEAGRAYRPQVSFPKPGPHIDPPPLLWTGPCGLVGPLLATLPSLPVSTAEAGSLFLDLAPCPAAARVVVGTQGDGRDDRILRPSRSLSLLKEGGHVC